MTVTDQRYSPAVTDTSVGWEQAMMGRVLVGDERALASIYDQYSSLVYGIAQRLLGATAAADITQQVFLQLWERPDAWAPERGTLRTFLAVVARRRSVDMLRGSSRSERRERVASSRLPVPVPDVDEAAMAMIASERVHQAVETLPAEQRQAIELAYFGGLTFREVAVATGVAEGTAKSRLRLALKRLALALNDEGTVETA
jgi:RNA polymerase sigma factor (sigma-70 family)